MQMLSWLVQLTPKLLATGKGHHQCWDGSYITYSFSFLFWIANGLWKHQQSLGKVAIIGLKVLHTFFLYWHLKDSCLSEAVWFGRMQHILRIVWISSPVIWSKSVFFLFFYEETCSEIQNLIMNRRQTALIKEVDNSKLIIQNEKWLWIYNKLLQ